MSVTVRRFWRGPFDVEALAIESVEAAAAAARRLARARGAPDEIETTSELIAAAFAAPSHLRVDGRAPAQWAPLSGFVRTRDGFLRTHANYPHHAEAITRATGAADRPALDDAAASWRADDLEQVILDAGGVATRVRTHQEWLAHPHEQATAADPWISRADGAERPVLASAGVPLDGARILDLTRVLAGPSATQLLACLGADVLRVDPPHRPELTPQHLLTGMGKRSAVADLADDAERVRALAREADVVLIGYRPGSLERFGLSPEQIAADDPTTVVAQLCAWGDAGPWGEARGFDSIVQAATGIAAECGDDDQPGALPVQALDYATGARLAAAVMDMLADARGGIVHASLLGAARDLLARPRREAGAADPLGVPVVNLTTPHGEILAPPPPLLVGRRTIERRVGGYGAAELAWADQRTRIAPG